VEADAPEALPSRGIADGVVRSLDPRYIPLQRKAGWIGVAAAVPIAALSQAFALFVWRSSLAFVVVGLVACVVLALLAWLAHGWPPLVYRHASYRVDADGLEIRRGVLWREVVNVPRSRVQHTDVSQGPMERSHGLATLIVHTAGVEHAQVQLAGLSYEVALAIRDHLLPRHAADVV
jgi:hypothetical protein